ncbi:Gfo/Idh/MocA family protein [Microlunatus soli]|uniref:Predicted dehydrogenase n=1 Tax=Microlunatus soli TaxID=630515 RepID=A0A1H1TWH1_9ACTN|nr:Gfo/Idh/MocA family oxidoreductase [Microlunatus soli]SDS64568.1 Predicted dehydrogenase [Microlunatus soli]
MPESPIIPAPRPRQPAPALKWGILGPGGIAGRFVDALHRQSDQQVVAVGSRALARAQEFAARHDIPQPVGSPAELVGLDEVDVVYIATPHDSHRAMAELALNAGKHIVVEKPFMMTEDDARSVFELARHNGLFAMEAMWTRYLPQADVLAQILEAELIGEVTYVAADFGFVANYDPKHRLFNPDLGGGALLDAGVYPVSFISSVLGAPRAVHAVGSLAATGVDDHAQLSLSYERALACAVTSLRSALPVTAVIGGTKGRVEVDSPYIRPSGLMLSTKAMWGPDPDAVRWTDTALAEPYDALHYQAIAAAGYIGEGLVESPIHTHQETTAVVGVLEQARRQLGAR